MNYPEWRLAVHYKISDLVRYKGNTYKCYQSHTPHVPEWNPGDTVDILWKLVKNI